MFSGAKLACRDVGASARFVGCDKGCDGASVSVPKPKPSENPKSTSFILRCLEISVVSCCFASRGKGETRTLLRAVAFAASLHDL